MTVHQTTMPPLRVMMSEPSDVGAAKLHLEAADILVPFEVKVVEKMPLGLGDRPVAPVTTAETGRVLDEYSLRRQATNDNKQ